MTHRLVYDRTAELVDWAERRTPGAKYRPDAVAIGVERAGQICGVFVCDTFSTTSCFMHVASDGSSTWLPRDPRAVLIPIFAYPFIQCGYRRISCVIAAGNVRSRRFARRMGCQEEGVMREAAPDGQDYILLGMLRRECRYLP